MSDREYLPKRSSSPYTKAFEDYWARVDSYIAVSQPWQCERVKRLAFNAWKSGRRSVM